MRFILNILRICLACLFIFSGFVKCIDPTGGAIKIEDYFFAWGFDSPQYLNLGLSFIQNILEFMAGFMLLLDLYVPISSLVAMIFMVIFTPLTLYIALENPVTDCGCFGDAVKLTNWETFAKNIIFLPISIIIFHYRRLFCSSLRPWRKATACCLGVMISFCVSLAGLTNEPFIDFRPYAVGVNIEKAMEIPEDAEQPQYQTTFILEKEGQQKEFDENNYPYNDTTWHFIDSKTVVISEGYVPPIHDFTLLDRYSNSMTEELLASSTPVILAISPNLDDIAEDNIFVLRDINNACNNSQTQFFIVTASASGAQTKLEQTAEMGFDFLTADETMLKTVTRCNPGIIAIENGTIVAKYHIDHLPDVAEFVDDPVGTYLQENTLYNVRLTMLSIVLITIISLTLLYKRNKPKHKIKQA